VTATDTAWVRTRERFARAHPAMQVAALVLAALLLALVVALAVQRGRAMVQGTDFHGRWIAGRWFFSGQPLYVYQVGFADPTYPPFAAMVFQLFALLPLPVAAGIFFVVNLALVPVVVLLVRRIMVATWPGWPGGWPLALAGVLSLEYFLANLNSVNVNFALFALVLWGMASWVNGHQRRATVAFVLATGIKLIPIFFVCWAVLRGRRPVLVTAVVAGAAVMLLPLVQRGPAQGMRDLEDYRTTLLAGVVRGEVNARATNHSLAGAVHRLTRPPQPPEPDYRVVHWSARTVRSLTRTATIAVGLSFLATVVALRLHREPLSPFEWSAAFLAGHLVSAMTWRAHLVTLLFVLTVVFSVPVRRLHPAAQAAWWGTTALAAFVGLSGRDLVGRPVFKWVNGHGIVSAALLALFIAAMVWCHRRLRVWEPGLPGRAR